MAKKQVPPNKRHKSDSVKKKPRLDTKIKSTINENIVWQTNILDLEGPWGWKNMDHGFFFDRLLPKIQHFEKMTWSEILGRTNHEVYINQIGKKAQNRLAKLKLDDNEKLVSLRLTGPQRLWGIRFENIFRILWWDPKHEVYPSKKK
ncbi:MAG: hypothetical protein R6V54_00325 [Desulfobacteraceae bacterium]